MSTVRQGREILGLLQALMGPPAVGSAIVRATEATGTVPAHSYAIPLESGELIEDALVHVRPNPATEDGSWPVSNAGTPIAIESVLGGPRGNILSPNALLRWDPVLSGIEAVSAISAGLSGGAFYDEQPVLRQARLYKELGRDVVSTLFAAQVGDTPAAVLAWQSSGPADGVGQPALGSTQSRLGNGKKLWKNTWMLWLITSRFEGDHLRRREGDELRDLVLELLTDRTAFRGAALSKPQGLQILEASVFQVTPTSYVDLVRFASTYTLQRRDEQHFREWERTRVRIETKPDPAGEKIGLPDLMAKMP